jgi:hypothetical protein
LFLPRRAPPDVAIVRPTGMPERASKKNSYVKDRSERSVFRSEPPGLPGGGNEGAKAVREPADLDEAQPHGEEEAGPE